MVGSWGFASHHFVEYVRLLPALVARYSLGTLVSTFPLEEAETALAAVAAGTVLKAVLATAVARHGRGPTMTGDSLGGGYQVYA